MKKTFLEYNPHSEEILNDLWEKAIFAFDTNVLLNLYRYSDETSKNFLDTIIELNGRIWLPHQVGYEFHKNRLSVISDQRKAYEDFEKNITKLVDEVENRNRNPFISDDLFKRLISIKDDIKKEIDVKVKAYNESLNLDSLLDRINTTFDGKVGSYTPIADLKKLYSEGETRYKEKIPPGYCDAKKLDNDKYGDLVLWKQIISHSKKEKIDIIFILDDRKEDWWLEHQGKTISPRPELLKEFRTETNQNCHFYKPFQFLEYSNAYLGSKIRKEAIEEVKNYKSETIKNDSYIQINLDLQGNSSDLNILISEMRNAGYNVFIESSLNINVHNLCIILPNIPDLERRLDSKYLSNLINYNIILINRIRK